MLDRLNRGRRGRGLFAAGAAAALVAASMTLGASSASATDGTPSGDIAPLNIEADLAAELAGGGESTFFVYLSERADLSQAPVHTAQGTVDRAANTAWVFEELTSVAEASQADLQAALDRQGVEYESFWISNAVKVTGDEALAHRLARHPDVSHLEADRTYHIIEPVERVAADGDNSIASVEWGVANINADDVWAEFGATGQGIVVASIDTGVRYTHSALVDQYRGNLGGGNFDHNYNWHDPQGSSAPNDPNDHGTHVTGTMVGDDGGSNQIGVAPGAQWVAAQGCGTFGCSSSDLLSSGQWMVAPTDLNGNNPDPSMAPHIVNNSWGGGSGDTWYQDTINSWVNAGIFPMFAIGNSGSSCNTANSPGDNIPAYGVGAYDSGNTIANFSSRGYSGVDGTTIKPNASAPGVSVRSATAGGDSAYGSFSGTSMASPHAAGLVALVWSAAPDFVGDIDATRALLDGTARSTSDLQCGGTADNNNVYGQGRVDAHAAVNEASDGEPPTPPPNAEFTFNCDDETLTCTFDGSGSSSAEGTITDWAWDFGDGTTGSGEVVTHSYGSSGSFDVTLTVTDDLGGTDSDTQPVTVGDLVPPVADFTHSCSVFWFFWMSCSFDGSHSEAPSGDIVEWHWDFGDGGTGSGETVSYLYSGFGPFNVTLTVTDDNGQTDAITSTVP
jgi:subtilisin family serine protease